MLKMGMKKAAIYVCTAILASGTVGAGHVAFGATQYETDKNQGEVKGRLFVSAGLELAISYDGNGNVLEIKGIDRDGKEFLSGQKDYTGKSCKEALKGLVRKMDENGCFDSKAGASKPSLTIKLEKGSKYPDDHFMKDIKKGVLGVMDQRDIDANLKVVGTQSLDDKGFPSKEGIEKMVQEQLGLGAGSVDVKDCELDDGVYEIDVLINGVAYEVELNAVSGQIVDMDRDDDQEDAMDKDDDDRYDDDHGYETGVPYQDAASHESSRGHDRSDGGHGHNSHMNHDHDDDDDNDNEEDDD